MSCPIKMSTTIGGKTINIISYYTMRNKDSLTTLEAPFIFEFDFIVISMHSVCTMMLNMIQIFSLSISANISLHSMYLLSEAYVYGVAAN